MSFSWMEALKVINIRKVSAELCVAFALASGFALFVPSQLAARLGIETLRDTHRLYLGVAFILSTSLLLSKAFALAWHTFVMHAARWRETKQLRNLTPDQKSLLREYMVRDTCTLKFLITDGVAQGLEHLGFIYRSSLVGTQMTGFPYNIQPWVRECLKKHPEFIAGVVAAQSTKRR